MNIENITPENIMKALDNLVIELHTANNHTAAETLQSIVESLAYYFEQKRQRDI